MNTLVLEHDNLWQADDAVRNLVIEEITNSGDLELAVLIRLSKVSTEVPDNFCRVVLFFNQDFHALIASLFQAVF